MLSFFKNIFGTSDAASKIVDNISSGIDKIWYTEEEKSEDVAQARREGNAVYMEWLRSTTGSRVARRFIAIIVTLIWASQYLASLLLGMIAPWVEPEVAKSMMESAKFLSENGEQGNGAFMVILGFYFLGNKADMMFRSAVDKFTKTKKDK